MGTVLKYSLSILVSTVSECSSHHGDDEGWEDIISTRGADKGTGDGDSTIEISAS